MNKTKRINQCFTSIFSWVMPFGLGAVINFSPIFITNTAAAVSAVSASATSTTGSVSANKLIETEKIKKADKVKPEPVFATVNGKSILVREYDALLASMMRQRFFHGKIPEDQVEAVRKEITDELVNRELMVIEAKKRGIVPDPAKFESVLAEYDARYGTDPGWAQQREQFLPDLKKQVDRHSLVEQMEKVLRDVPQPTEKEARAYYNKRPELFTEPESPRLSVISLKVDPSSPIEVWSKAVEEAKGIYERIKGGDDFAEEARLHSADDSADRGGDMGYVHAGMLSKELEDKLKKLKIGEMTEPVQMLDGVSLYRIEDRIPAKLQEFTAVEKRVRDLLVRDRVEKARSDSIRRMRSAAKVKIFYPAPSGVTGKAAKKK